MTTPISLNISGWTRQPVGFPVLDGNFPNSVRSGSGTGNGYTEDHYVAPYASVSGATSDEDVQDAAAYTASTSSGAPCTFACAMVNAAAGDIIQSAPGVTVGTATASRWDPCFSPTNNGTSLDPIIFAAEYPAAYNYGVTALYSELRRTDYAAGPSEEEGGILNTDGSDYIVFDGFYINEDVSYSGPGIGVFGLSQGSTNCELRRVVVDRPTTSIYSGGHNGNCVHTIGCVDCLITDSKFVGTGVGFGRNNGAIETYNSDTLTIEHCDIDDVGTHMFVKTEHVATPEQHIAVVVRYNKFANGLRGVEVQTVRSAYIYQNLFLHQSEWGVRWAPLSEVIGDVIFDLYSNTFYGSFVTNGALYLQGSSPYNIDVLSEWRDNLICTTGAANNYFMGADAVMSPDTINNMGRFNHNLWYDFGTSSDRWIIGTTTYSSFAAFQAAMASIGTDTYADNYGDADLNSDPEFVDAAGGDFTLAANSQAALTGSSSAGVMGAYITGSEEIGLRASPTY